MRPTAARRSWPTPWQAGESKRLLEAAGVQCSAESFWSRGEEKVPAPEAAGVLPRCLRAQSELFEL